MKDREFLTWIHARLQDHHVENPHMDFMHKLRAIILATPKEQTSPQVGAINNHDDLLRALREKESHG